MLGVKVSGAFARESGARVASFDVLRDGVRARISIPHPSGRNPIWNDPTKVDLARSILRREAPVVPWGEIDGATEISEAGLSHPAGSLIK
jgi:hypothetical protein